MSLGATPQNPRDGHNQPNGQHSSQKLSNEELFTYTAPSSEPPTVYYTSEPFIPNFEEPFVLIKGEIFRKLNSETGEKTSEKDVFEIDVLPSGSIIYPLYPKDSPTPVPVTIPENKDLQLFAHFKENSSSPIIVNSAPENFIVLPLNKLLEANRHTHDITFAANGETLECKLGGELTDTHSAIDLLSDSLQRSFINRRFGQKLKRSMIQSHGFKHIDGGIVFKNYGEALDALYDAALNEFDSLETIKKIERVRLELDNAKNVRNGDAYRYEVSLDNLRTELDIYKDGVVLRRSTSSDTKILSEKLDKRLATKSIRTILTLEPIEDSMFSLDLQPLSNISGLNSKTTAKLLSKEWLPHESDNPIYPSIQSQAMEHKGYKFELTAWFTNDVTDISGYDLTSGIFRDQSKLFVLDEFRSQLQLNFCIHPHQKYCFLQYEEAEAAKDLLTQINTILEYS